MLVDNAIVVVENIYRYMEEGWPSDWAAKKATGEVAIPVIASTATTLGAFAPLLFWPGVTGEFMGYLPKTLIVTLTSSLFVALIIVPVLCAMFMKLETDERRPMTRATRFTLAGGAALALLAIAGVNPLTAGLMLATALGAWALYHFVLASASVAFQERLVPVMLDNYERQLRSALNHRLAMVVGSVAVLVVTVAAFTRLNAGVEYFPEDIPPKQVFVDVELPVGTRADATDEIVRRMERDLKEVSGRDDWKSTVAVSGGSGGGGGAGAMMGQGGPSGPNAGRVTLSYVDFQDRQTDAFATLAWMQANIGTEVAGAEITVEQLQEGVASGAPVNIEISGEDPDQLEALSDRVLEILRNDAIIGKLVGLESDLDAARPELSVTVNRENAAIYELSTADVGRAIRGAIQGIEAAKYRTGTDEYDIIVRLAPEYRRELDQLAELNVMAEGGRQIPLSSVADWNVGEGYGTIRRKDQERMATISSDVAAGLNSNAVLGEVQVVLQDFARSELPPGYAIEYTGQQQEQDEAQEFLGGAFLTALLLIAFILISQFNSVVKPVIIMTSVMMSVVGVLMGLMVFRMPFGVIMTGVGIISLAGIVVNNAIVLIDYIDILRARDGMDRREALVQGGRTRFRPVVLTATTTALGLVPLAVGLNFDFFGLFTSLQPELYWGGDQAAWWGPMAIAVIVGIIFATFLTLVLVPVMYSLVDDFTRAFSQYFVHADAETEEEATPSPTDEGRYRAPTPPSVRTPEPAEVFRSGTPGLRPRTETG
jgi:multidrug efflux pump subunit AcrB